MSWRVGLHARVGDLEIDVEIEGGDAPVALIGPNGAGKTTLLRWIAGHELSASSGEIRVGGAELVDVRRGVSLPPERRGVGYVPQGYGLFEHLSVVDNVAFGLASAGMGRTERHGRAVELLDRLGCRHLEGRRPATLSGGERQKVALARALATEPRLLLLDEPMAALDASARRQMRAFLARQLAGRDAAAIMVTHDVRDVRAIARTVFVMEGGRIVQRGTPEELAARPASAFVAEVFDVTGGEGAGGTASSRDA